MKKPIPFGKYLLLDRINVGGMAEVFVAKAFGVEGFERLLAIKKILPTMVEDQEFITMFIDEARIAVQLNHANVVQISELGKHDENYYIAMEYVSGKDLRVLLDRFKKRGELMPLPMAVFVASKICEGLDYAHRKKDARGQELHIVHRDVSPQNILLSYEGEVKIIDFGIAKAANRAQKTQAGILKGKFGYMSPEQVRGLPVDRRSDIFAVGVILYEMLTGEKLFVGESDFSTLEKVRNAEVLPPTKYNEEIPEGLEKVVLKTLARDVEDRYEWASDLQEDLMRFLLSGESVFSTKAMAKFMKDAFADELRREQERMEKFAQIARPEGAEVSVVTATVTPSAPAVRSNGVKPPAPPQDGLMDPVGDESTGGGGGPPPTNERTQIFAMNFDEGAPVVPTAPLPAVQETADGDDTSPREATHERELARMDASLGPREVPPGTGGARRGGGGLLPEIPSDPSGRPVDSARTVIKPESAISAPVARKSGAIARPSANGRASGAAPRPASKAVQRPDAGTSSSMRVPSTGGAPMARPSPAQALMKNRLVLAGLGVVAVGCLVGVGIAFAIRPAGRAARPQQAQVQVATGTLIVYPDPKAGAVIEIDGKERTRDNFFMDQVPVGKHVVTVLWPGQKPMEETVEVQANQPFVKKMVLPPAAAPAAAAGGEGTPPEPIKYSASIDSDPSHADLYIDGRKVGVTPYTFDKDVDPSKTYDLEVKLSAYKPAAGVLSFKDNPTPRVSLQLEPAPEKVQRERSEKTERFAHAVERVTKAVEPAVAEQSPRPEPAPRPERKPKAERKARAPRGVGKLVATSNPIASVWVDGKDTGRTTPIAPIKPLELSAGTHTVEFRAPDGRKASKSIDIAPNELNKLVGVVLQ